MSLPIHLNTLQGFENMQQFSNLLDHGFQVPTGKHFLEDFPIWNIKCDDDSILRLGFFQKNTLVSAGGMRLAKLKILSPSSKKQKFLSIAILGGIVTDPNWQGKGLASQLIKKLMDWAAQKNAVLIAAWGTLHPLYQRLGFQQTGTQLRTSLRFFSSLPSSSTPLEILHGWDTKLFSCIQKERAKEKTPGLHLSERDAEWYTAHQNVHWFSARNPTTGEIIAYAGYGRGIDLCGLVHEWGGENMALHKIFQEIYIQYPQAELLFAPEHRDIFPFIKESCISSEFLCMTKRLNRKIQLENFPLWFWGLDSA